MKTKVANYKYFASHLSMANILNKCRVLPVAVGLGATRVGESAVEEGHRHGEQVATAH